MKYNRKGKPQERWLCIDGFNILNKEYKKEEDKNDNRKESGGASSFMGSLTTKLFGVKTKKRPIGSIVMYRRYGPQEFSIKFQDPDKKGEVKELRYRTSKPDECSQIIAKIKFLVTA